MLPSPWGRLVPLVRVPAAVTHLPQRKALFPKEKKVPLLAVNRALRELRILRLSPVRGSGVRPAGGSTGSVRTRSAACRWIRLPPSLPLSPYPPYPSYPTSLAAEMEKPHKPNSFPFRKPPLQPCCGALTHSFPPVHPPLLILAGRGSLCRYFLSLLKHFSQNKNGL